MSTHRRVRLSIALLAAIALGFVPSRARAQQSPSTTALQQRIERLEAQVAALQALLAKPPDAPADTPAAVPNAAATAPQADGGRADALRGLTFGVGLDTYYGFNFNRPVGRVNLLRAYDVTSNNFSVNQANLVFERAPDVAAGRRFGGRLDLQYGQATETLQGSLSNEPRPWVYRNIFQAYGTVALPAGAGLTIDFGKWASSLGIESNYAKDQMNYSRSFYFNYLPFYHTGARVSYAVNDAVSLNYWITNGTQQTEAFNNFKDQFFGVTLRPSTRVTWSTQYYLGQEHPDVTQVTEPGAPTLPTQPGLSITPVVPYYAGKLHIFDTYVTWQASDKTTVAAEADYVANHVTQDAPTAHVYGGAGYARRQLSGKTALAVRGEFLRDDGGAFSGVTQSLKEVTATYDYRVTDGFIIRGEYRRDFSNVPFFLTNDADARDKAQDTATLALLWWWGTKRGAW